MPRNARENSISGIYHIMLRGVNKQSIFEEGEDKKRLFQKLSYYKNISNFELYGYCFMDNHLHILMKEKFEPISLIVKRIMGSYALWFNEKYERCGHLFQERFKSESIESEAYLLAALRYVHQNPVKAGIAKNMWEFEWSSCHEYTKKPIVTDTSIVLDLFSPDRRKAIELFKEFMNVQNRDRCLDYRVRITDSEIRNMLLAHGVYNSHQLLQLQKHKRNEIIIVLKSLEGVSLRQLSRITGIPKSTIERL